MIQNITAAGFRRKPEAHGIPVKETKRAKMQGNKTMKLLQEAERKFPGVGLKLLDIYFSHTERSDEEKEFWKTIDEQRHPAHSKQGHQDFGHARFHIVWANNGQILKPQT